MVTTLLLIIPDMLSADPALNANLYTHKNYQVCSENMWIEISSNVCTYIYTNHVVHRMRMPRAAVSMSLSSPPPGGYIQLKNLMTALLLLQCRQEI